MRTALTITALSTLALSLAACDELPEGATGPDTVPTQVEIDDVEDEDDAVADVEDDDFEDEVEEGDDHDTLLFMREEEKLARDVYDFLDEAWGNPQVFANIMQSEQTHMDTLLVQIDRLDLVDPVVDDSRGVYQDPLLTDLYADLTTDGAASIEGALQVGALIEDLDIIDLRNAVAETDDVVLQAVYAQLECGSRNHLRAFTGQLEQRGITYVPSFLTQAEMDAILDSPRETCN